MIKLFFSAILAVLLPFCASAATIQAFHSKVEVGFSIDLSGIGGMEVDSYFYHSDNDYECSLTTNCRYLDRTYEFGQIGDTTTASIESAIAVEPLNAGTGGGFSAYDAFDGYVSASNETKTTQSVSWRIDWDTEVLSGYGLGDIDWRVESEYCSGYSVFGSQSGTVSCSVYLAPGQEILARFGAYYFIDVHASIAPVPLPAGGLLLLTGLSGLLFWRRKRSTS